MQADARAPAQAVRRGVAGQRLDLQGGRAPRQVLRPEAGEALQRLDEHLALELALVGESDVAELGAAGAAPRVAVETGGRPDVLAAVRARLEHGDGVGAPETLLAVVAHARPHRLARNGVGDEDHPPVEPPDRDAAVGDLVDGQFDLRADVLTHAFSLGLFAIQAVPTWERAHHVTDGRSA